MTDRPDGGRPLFRLARSRLALAAVALELAAVGLVAIESPFESFGVFLTLTGVMGVAYGFAVHYAWHLRDTRAVWFALAVGVILRATLLPFEHADDMHRYLWEGRVQLDGVNPFAVPPSAPELARFRDDVIYPDLNNKSHPAIYPPLSQLIFRALAACRLDFTFFKVVFTLFDLATIAGLVVLLRRRGAPMGRIVAYAWCPLVVFAIAGRGHLDAVQTCFTVWAIVAFLTGRLGVAGFVLGLAILSKTLAILLVPAFVLHTRRPWRLWPVVLPFALYALYADAGYGLVQSLWMFGREWSTNAFAYPLIESIGGRPAVYALAVVVVAIALLRSRTVEDGAFAAWATFLVFSPTFHPWYFVGLAPFLVFRPRPAWMLLSVTLFLYYSFLRTGTWAPIDWIPWLEFAPFFAALALTLLPRR